MFTGIIEEAGSVRSFSRDGGSWKLRIAAARVLEGLSVGDSVAVNGCCLTAVDLDGESVGFDVLDESRRLTNFQFLAPGAPVNLERSLRADSRLGGHFVTGHIDGLGRIEAFEARGSDHWLRVRGPAASGRLLVREGQHCPGRDVPHRRRGRGRTPSLGLDHPPYTLAVTNLRVRAPGDFVNLEFDMLGEVRGKAASIPLAMQGSPPCASQSMP